MIIDIYLARIYIFGYTVPEQTLDFHAVMTQSMWDQQGKKSSSSHHTLPSFEFHLVYVSESMYSKQLGIQY
jgi:hypothetical protein